jgi:hypothetical protein
MDESLTVLLLVSGLRSPWSRRSQTLGVCNKELNEDTQIAQSSSKVLLRVKAGAYTFQGSEGVGSGEVA